MDQIEEYDEELEEEPYEYNMPLSGDALSPEVGRSRESEDSMEFHNERRDKSTPLSGSRRESERSWAANSHRTSQRYSQQSDVTPRFHNRVTSGRLSSHGEELGGLPSIPFRDHSSPRSMNRDQSQNSLSTFMSKNNNSVTFNLEHNEHDSISEPSLPLHSTGGNLTPTSNAASSYNGRTPDGSRRSMRQMRMDGTITTLPLSPQGESNVSVASTMNSRSHSLYSPERAPEDRRKSYDNTDHDSRDASPNGSMHSMFSERYPTQHNKDHDARSSDDDGDMYDPILCCGFVLPVWLSYSIPRTPSLNRISRCLVNALPCFWCCGDASQGSSTDRAILTRLNMICLFMTLVQLIMSMWLATVLLILDDEPGALRGFSPHLWNLNGAALSIGILAFILMVTCSCTIRVVREVDLVGVIRYLWVVLWIVPFEIFFNISLYDYHNVTKVWISHWWLQDHMSWFRGFFCPDGTEFNKCLVPILGGANFDSENMWCLAKYNSTDCTQIRDYAQSRMETLMLTFYTGLAGWSSVLLFFMMLVVNSLERIITKPIVQKSRESNVPAWLSLPSLTNGLVGIVLLFSPSSLLSSSSGAERSWIGIVYLVAGGLFLVALITGWYLSAYTIRNHADKQTKNIAVLILIIMMAANVVMLATIFVASILFSAELINSPIDESQRGEVACNVDRNATCTRCDALVPRDRCPEWGLDEVTTILQTQLKQSAALASIFVLYAVSVLRFGVTLRRHLSLYQIDYV